MILLINLIFATSLDIDSKLETVVVNGEYDDDIDTADFDMISLSDSLLNRGLLCDEEIINNIESLEEVTEENIKEEDDPYCDTYLKHSTIFLCVVALISVCFLTFFSSYI